VFIKYRVSVILIQCIEVKQTLLLAFLKEIPESIVLSLHSDWLVFFKVAWFNGRSKQRRPQVRLK